MAFFSKFPQIVVSNITVGKKKKTVMMTDLIRRVAVGEKFRNLSSFLTPYLVRDGDTPEIVASQLYGNPEYHWVILLVNEIIDPRTEWVMSQRDMLNMIYDKYDIAVNVADTYDVDVGDEMTSSRGGRFIVGRTTFFTSPSGQRAFTLHSQRGATTLIPGDTLVNITKSVTDIPIIQVIGAENNLHHFESGSGAILATYEGALAGDIPEFVDPGMKLVTNFEYENALNDRKRQIKVLDPAYLGRFVTDFEREIDR